MNTEDPEPMHRLELTLRKPWLGWYPKPTVVFGGRGQPAQWGTGTWQLGGEPVEIEVFLFNRLWRFGEARAVVDPGHAASLVYRAPWLPFLRGSLRPGNIECDAGE